jgi:Tol biopolymer transport system component
MSPDGRTIVTWYSERTAEGSATTKLYTRRLGGYEHRLVEGSEGARWNPAFSPDGRWLAFVAPVTPGGSNFHLVKVPVDGGAPPFPMASWPRGLQPDIAWLPDGHIAALRGRPPSLVRVPTDGGAPEPPVQLHGTEPADFIRLAYVLPDGRNILALGWYQKEISGQWNMLSVDARTAETRLLVENAAGASLSPTGHLLFARRDKLLAAPFDLERLETTGGPVAIADGLRTAPSTGDMGSFDLSETGTLVYRPGGIVDDTRRLAFLERDGQFRPWSDDRRSFAGKGGTVSPDGRRLAITIANPEDARIEIWVSEIEPPRLRLLASEPGQNCEFPVWSGDAERVVYLCRHGAHEGGVYIRRFDGTDEPQLLLKHEQGVRYTPTSMSPDGSRLLLNRTAGGKTSSVVLPLEAEPGEAPVPTDLLTGGPASARAVFSPDGRWIAYQSAETGRLEIHLRRFGRDGQLGPRIQVSTDGGYWPEWENGGGGSPWDLFYALGFRVMAISIDTDPAFTASAPRQVVDFAESELLWLGHLSDGRSLVVLKSDEERETRINVVLNFHEEIKRKFAEAE